MAAWAASPYRAIGVYIGGGNRGCSQPNLTASWVGAQTAAGWHLIPTYVGLQAPTSSCSQLRQAQRQPRRPRRAKKRPSTRSPRPPPWRSGPGSPIYFDMESYTRTSSATAATLAFLEAWTEKLHSLGYVSGVYSSSASGIADLAGQLGSGYSPARRPLDRQLERPGQQPPTPTSPPAAGASTSASTSTAAATTRPTAASRSTSTTTTSTAAPSARRRRPRPTKTRSARSTWSARPTPGQVRVKGWAFDPNAPTEPLAIRAYIGGQAGRPRRRRLRPRPVANQAAPRRRRQVPARPAPATASTSPSRPSKSGPQPVCVYALNTGGGADRLLGCKSTTVPVAVTLSVLKTTPTSVKVWVACAWPQGRSAPASSPLRTRVKIALPHRRGKPPRIRAVTRSLGRRGFQLSGQQGHGFVIPLSAGGRALLKQRGQLRSQLIAAIPGGRRIVTVGLGR